MLGKRAWLHRCWKAEANFNHLAKPSIYSSCTVTLHSLCCHIISNSRFFPFHLFLLFGLPDSGYWFSKYNRKLQALLSGLWLIFINWVGCYISRLAFTYFSFWQRVIASDIKECVCRAPDTPYDGLYFSIRYGLSLICWPICRLLLNLLATVFVLAKPKMWS